MLRPILLRGLLLCGLLPLEAAAQDRGERQPSVRTTPNDIRLDGRLDEPDWALADSIWEFRQKEPVENGEPTERTVVRLLATPGGLAVGWWLYDRHPDGIVRTQLRRDAALRSDDYVSMVIDGLSDQRSAFYFRANSNGALWDGEHINIESGNEEWDGIWDARAEITAEGWTLEMFIPWATLRYPEDVTQMGMNFRRFLPRTNEELLWRAWRRTEGLRFLEKEGTITGFSNLPRRARAELRPYVLGQAEPAERLFAADGSSTVSRGAQSFGAAGLDVKIPVTATLTADLTTNPDFAQADVDRQIVNLTRFPVFFPERRPFFTEGASVFAFGREQQTQLFYSRRIGLSDARTPVTIPFGARMQGRAGAYQLGFLAAGTEDGEDARNVVGRVRRDVLGRGFVGAMATYSDRPTREGSLAGGVDFNLPYVVGKGNNLVVLGNAAWSRDSVNGAVGAHYRVMVDYPNDHADIVMRYDRVDEAYDPALGFVVQRGIHRLAGSTAITPRPRNASLIRRYEFNVLNYNAVWDIDGGLDNAMFSVRPFGLQFQSGDRVELNVFRLFDGPDETFEIVSGVGIPAGKYWWDRVELKYEGSNVRPLVFSTEVSTGAFYTGSRLDLEASLLARVQPHYEFRLEYERNEIDLVEGAFTTNVARLRADYAVNARLMVTGFAQYDDQSERAALNARLRWTPSPGSDLFVVWNSVWPVEPWNAFSFARPQRGALVVKYTQYLRI
jgi:hypothetical protein